MYTVSNLRSSVGKASSLDPARLHGTYQLRMPIWQCHYRYPVQLGGLYRSDIF